MTIKPSKKRSNSLVNGSNKKKKSDSEPFNIQNIESRVLESARNYNDILIILGKLTDSQDNDEYFDISASLVKIFGKLAKDGILSNRKLSHLAKEKASHWLMERYNEFKQILQDEVIKPKQLEFSSISLASLLKLIAIESKYLNSEEYYYPKSTFRQTLNACMSSAESIHLLSQIAAEIYLQYDDFRFYFYQELAHLLTDEEYEETRKNCMNVNSSSEILDLLLLAAEHKPEESDDRNWWLSEPIASKSSLKQLTPLKVSSHKVVFQKCWIAVLRLVNTQSQYHKVLEVIHKKIIPNMSKPQMLMDFLTDAYNSGGIVSFLALNSVFLLMQKYNLDYPDFFTKLYALLEDGTIMHVKYRSRVLKLMDLFLTSTHLPSAIAASFIKRISRSALTAPVGAIISIVPFIYNQLKRHPTCMVMIQRPNADEFSDMFDNQEKDPLKTNAIDSSLWELETLQHHYHPNVATLAKIMSQPFTKPQYALDDFLDYNYRSLVKAELARKMKNTPPLEYEQFDKLMGENGYLENVTW